VTLFIGIANILLGLAYSGLGTLSAWETFSLHRYRGWSRFGIGFSLMAASCGPHHLIHGWHVVHGAPVTGPMLAASIIGLPAGLAFVLLRIETMLGGRGDRTLTISPQRIIFLTSAFAVTAGALATWTLARPPAPFGWPQVLCTTSGLATTAPGQAAGISPGSLTLMSNLFVTVTYGMVGWFLSDTQVRRRITGGAWSLSGLSLAGVFITCGFMHLIHAFTIDAHSPTLPFDLLGIPASIYFLWTVKLVHNDSVVDWNRRPLIGVAVTPERSSPWSGPGPLARSRN
jgi:hypothetical protein